MMNPRKVIHVATPQKAGVRKRPARQGGAEAKRKEGTAPRPATEKRLPPLPWWKRISALTARTLLFGGSAVALALLGVVILISGSPRKEEPQKTAPKAAALLPGVLPEGQADQPPARPLRKEGITQEKERPAVLSIRLHPPQATRMDTLRAEVVAAAYADPGRIAYTYAWKVNDRKIEEAKGETLDLSPFKKRDLVTVTVTPYDGDNIGFPMEGPLIVIHGIPPSLELKAPLQKTKVGEPQAFQLVSLHPDSDGVTFRLEDPLVPGMSIDGPTGKITWTIPPNQKGTVRFGASVEDNEKTKVAKTFELKVE